MKIACHTITWGVERFVQALDEISELGFTGFETFASIVDDFDGARSEDFQRLIRQRNLQLVALYGGGDMHKPESFEEVLSRNVRIARFLHRNGADRLVLGPGRRPEGGPTQEDLLALVHCANEIGRQTREMGVLACLHPHVNTVVETIPEIDFVVDLLDPRYVAIAADAAHFSKGNPTVPGAEIDVLRRHIERIKYVHLKDWDPTLPPEATGEGGTAIIRDFTELGQGQIDLRGCIAVLQDNHYDGWATVELDYTRQTPYESVRLSIQFLETLGLTVGQDS